MMCFLFDLLNNGVIMDVFETDRKNIKQNLMDDTGLSNSYYYKSRKRYFV